MNHVLLFFIRPFLSTAGAYIASNIFRFFGLILLGLLGLFFVLDLLAELESVGQGSYSLQLAAVFTALQIPARAYDAMPIAVVASAVLGLSVMATQSEVTVLRSAGFTPAMLFKTMLWVGAPLVLITVLLGEVVQPLSDKAAAQIKLKALNQVIGGELRSGAWLRSKTADNELHYLNVRNMTADETWQQITVYQFSADGVMKRWITAKTGQYLAEQKAWALRDVALQTLTGHGAQTQVEQRPEWLWQTEIEPSALAGSQKSAKRQSLAKLTQHIVFSLRNDIDARQATSTLLRRLLHPFGIWVMLLLALPFAYVRARGGGVVGKMFAGVLMGIVFHTGNNLFQFLALLKGWPLLLTMQMPLWIGLAVAALLFWRFHRLY